MLKVKSKGNWDRTNKFFKKSVRITKFEKITSMADDCLERLKDATPTDSGITNDSWSYEIDTSKNKKVLRILNSNIQNGNKIVLLLEFGHVSRSGTWVEGLNYIGPTTLKAYNDIISDTRKELNKL